VDDEFVPTAVSGSRRWPFEYGLVDDSRRTEFTLAVIRLILGSVSLVAVYLDPTSPRTYAWLASRLLAAYVAYAVALLVVLRSRRRLGPPAGLVIHAGDVVVAFAMTLFTEGPASPFFVFFGFALLAAGFRWGLWGTIWTGAVSAMLLGGEAVLVTSSYWPGTLIEGRFELNRFMIRCTYVVLLALIAEKEKTTRETVAILASAAERARVARELHDGVIQSLLGLRMQLEVLRRREPDGSTIGSELARIEGLLEGELENLRTLMFARTPVDAGSQELSTLVRDLVEQFERASGISARFVSIGDLGLASPDASHEIWCIVQEALVNVHKHSGARNVLVSFSVQSEEWSIIVDDDGRGFDFTGTLTHEALERARKGPRVIKERVRLLGGSLAIESTPGAGARLEIALPREV